MGYHHRWENYSTSSHSGERLVLYQISFDTHWLTCNEAIASPFGQSVGSEASLWWRDGKNGLSVLVRCCTCLADVRNCKRVTKTGRMPDEGEFPVFQAGKCQIDKMHLLDSVYQLMGHVLCTSINCSERNKICVILFAHDEIF